MRNTLVLSTLLLTSFAFAQRVPQPDDLIVPQTAAARILIPVAGDAPGANGTHFRSDIDLINLRGTNQSVNLRWLPEGRTGIGIGHRTLVLAARSGIASEDFVGEIMNQSGIGAIEITGVTPGGAFDEDAQLHVTARIWTPVPNAPDSRTMSQTFPAIVMPTEFSPVKSIFGLRRSDQYRLNVGVVNPASTTERFRITTYIFNPPLPNEVVVMQVDIDPRSIRQMSIPATGFGTAQVLVENLTNGAESWHAWGSSIDNLSGDAWSQMAISGQ